MDIPNLDQTIPMSFWGFFKNSITFFAAVIGISFVLPMFLPLLVPMLFLFYFIQRYYIPTNRQLKRILSAANSPVLSHFTETLHGVSSIRAYGLEAAVTKQVFHKMDALGRANYATIISQGWLQTRLDFCGCLVIGGTSLLTVFNVMGYFGNSVVISVGVVGLAMNYACNLTDQLNYLTQSTSQMEASMVNVERVIEVSFFSFANFFTFTFTICVCFTVGFKKKL